MEGLEHSAHFPRSNEPWDILVCPSGECRETQVPQVSEYRRESAASPIDLGFDGLCCDREYNIARGEMQVRTPFCYNMDIWMEKCKRLPC